MHNQYEAVVNVNEDTRVNSHPHISKGESQRHQVDVMNKTEYIEFENGDTKIQQDMLIVSIPLVELCDVGRLTRIMLIQVGNGENIEERL